MRLPQYRLAMPGELAKTWLSWVRMPCNLPGSTSLKWIHVIQVFEAYHYSLLPVISEWVTVTRILLLPYARPTTDAMQHVSYRRIQQVAHSMSSYSAQNVPIIYYGFCLPAASLRLELSRQYLRLRSPTFFPGEDLVIWYISEGLSAVLTTDDPAHQFPRPQYQDGAVVEYLEKLPEDLYAGLYNP